MSHNSDCNSLLTDGSDAEIDAENLHNAVNTFITIFGDGETQPDKPNIVFSRSRWMIAYICMSETLTVRDQYDYESVLATHQARMGILYAIYDESIDITVQLKNVTRDLYTISFTIGSKWLGDYVRAIVRSFNPNARLSLIHQTTPPSPPPQQSTVTVTPSPPRQKKRKQKVPDFMSDLSYQYRDDASIDVNDYTPDEDGYLTYIDSVHPEYLMHKKAIRRWRQLMKRDGSINNRNAWLANIKKRHMSFGVANDESDSFEDSVEKTLMTQSSNRTSPNQIIIRRGKRKGNDQDLLRYIASVPHNTITQRYIIENYDGRIADILKSLTGEEAFRIALEGVCRRYKANDFK